MNSEEGEIIEKGGTYITSSPLQTSPPNGDITATESSADLLGNREVLDIDNGQLDTVSIKATPRHPSELGKSSDTDESSTIQQSQGSSDTDESITVQQQEASVTDQLVAQHQKSISDAEELASLPQNIPGTAESSRHEDKTSHSVEASSDQEQTPHSLEPSILQEEPNSHSVEPPILEEQSTQNVVVDEQVGKVEKLTGFLRNMVGKVLTQGPTTHKQQPQLSPGKQITDEQINILGSEFGRKLFESVLGQHLGTIDEIRFLEEMNMAVITKCTEKLSVSQEMEKTINDTDMKGVELQQLLDEIEALNCTVDQLEITVEELDGWSQRLEMQSRQL